MNPFHPLAWAHDTFWSLFTHGTVGLTAHSFDDADTATARPVVQPRPVVETPRAYRQAELPQEAIGMTWSSERFEHEGTTYDVKLYIPSAYDGRPLPMIVMLHGAQQDSDDFATGTEMNVVAEERGFIVVYPEQPESSNPLKCWNWFLPANQMRESGETAAIAALTRDVMARYNVDDARVYVAGMSAGGALAVNLAVTHPDLYAAAAVHSGLAFGVADEQISALCAMNDGRGKVRLPQASFAASGTRAVPLIVFHGDADDTVHPLNSEQIVEMSRLMHCDVEGALPSAAARAGRHEDGHAYTQRVFHDRDGVPVGEQWLVHGLGHAWSGGHPDGTHTDARGPHASREIVRFFDQFAIDRTAIQGDVCGRSEMSLP
ncbi:extracellular catalytic domain type 1 short-chain-length polyhydroxyalkanoate depolymerase [Caballeronia insecticola]|uniref:Esterase poly(3-hydroxybutyrate) depolymerase n=1 Tax=Caballeronia insecticola TaxID=758793 RepID=R4X3U1_9BURK|nr:PHB depolymerase family esterase [Caballeronia insecticola]BAN26697.1 esterase poly(3-hydroxybutyrate) depolymerase [Caballeronia insecticola]